MEINWRFQSLHTDSSNIDWLKVQEVERDICMLYHQLADYSHIMGDLYYGNLYSLPYWDFLDISLGNKEDDDFIRDGCLVMILAMSWDSIDGSGRYIQKYIDKCIVNVTKIKSNDPNTIKLITTVQVALKCALENIETDEVVTLSNWVHDEYIKGYFRRRVNDFDSNPYFNKNFPSQ